MVKPVSSYMALSLGSGLAWMAVNGIHRSILPLPPPAPNQGTVSSTPRDTPILSDDDLKKMSRTLFIKTATVLADDELSSAIGIIKTFCTANDCSFVDAKRGKNSIIIEMFDRPNAIKLANALRELKSDSPIFPKYKSVRVSSVR